MSTASTVRTVLAPIVSTACTRGLSRSLPVAHTVGLAGPLRTQSTQSTHSAHSTPSSAGSWAVPLCSGIVFWPTGDEKMKQKYVDFAKQLQVRSVHIHTRPTTEGRQAQA